ncbi:ArnT family glycosyltransferase [Natronomonas amylolytica]|uniref:ArnT family glycosyltransferase n=1 Tax=Natronomonas amylolytica TaxID=3108498 RepID=UPI003009227C
MWEHARLFLRSVSATIRSDLSEDDSLSFILFGTALLAGFWFWYRVPNFAGPDEYSRLLQPIKTAGYVAADPSIEALRRGLLDGRALGATFYVYALVLAPLAVLVLVSGQFSEFVSLGSVTSRWTLWHEAPVWFWTGAVLFSRLVLIVFAAGCVYLTYRLGVRLQDRRTGRYASALLMLSLGFVSKAHEAGEDLPMLFFFLLATYLAVRFIQTGDERSFLVGAAIGGLAIAFKLTAGVVVFVLAGSLVARSLKTDGAWYSGLLRPKLIAGGLALGSVAIYVGIPSILVSGPEALLTRVFHTAGQKTALSGGREAPIWYWISKGYLEGFGLPLGLATVVAIPVSFLFLRKQSVSIHAAALLLVALVVYLMVFFQWSYLRMHHLLPTFPLMLLLLGMVLAGLNKQRPLLGHTLVAILVVTSALYAGGGVIKYATEPRDQATDWMESNVDQGERVVVYENSIADVAAIHGRTVEHYPYDEENATYSSSLVLNESAYTEWMISTPGRGPEYIQLTAADIRYLDPFSPLAEKYPRRAEYIRQLLDGDNGYRIAVEFGNRPEYRTPNAELIRTGVKPTPDPYEEYVVILERDD